MKVELFQMVQDPTLSDIGVGKIVEGWRGSDEGHYLDGPIVPRVAVIDLDPTTEQLRPGTRFIPPGDGRTLGRYAVNKEKVRSQAFIRASSFATVVRTLSMFEEPDTLGRKVTWAFGAPQLLVVPRAGWLPNAYYERRSRSLQFFAFQARNGQIVYTSLSRDIVAHETAHAVIDGIAPDLYDALDPQSLAIHEGLADLTAMLLAFRSGRLRKAVLDANEGSIENSTAFSSIAEEFGKEIDPTGQIGYLRNLRNKEQITKPPGNEPEPHELSQVISGVLYEFMCKLHTDYKKRLAQRTGKTEFNVSGLALYGASEQFKRMVLRGLDYLPPGEVTFADLGRAILAADQASYEDDTDRIWLRDAFAWRGIVKDADELRVKTNFGQEHLAGVDLDALVASSWAAYHFADEHRELLRIPDDAQFEVLPRVVVSGRFETPGQILDRTEAIEGASPSEGSGPAVSAELEEDVADQVPGLPGADDVVDVQQRAASQASAAMRQIEPLEELLFKVRWSVLEDNPRDLGLPKQRRVQSGVTLVIDKRAGQIRSLLWPEDLPKRGAARDGTLQRLYGLGLVRTASASDPPAQRRSPISGIEAVEADDILRIKETARLLHIAKVVDDE